MSLLEKLSLLAGVISTALTLTGLFGLSFFKLEQACVFGCLSLSSYFLLRLRPEKEFGIPDPKLYPFRKAIRSTVGTIVGFILLYGILARAQYGTFILSVRPDSSYKARSAGQLKIEFFPLERVRFTRILIILFPVTLRLRKNLRFSNGR